MIRYKVKARLARNLGTDDFSLEEFEKEFVNEKEPIKARKEAFSYYMSIVDVINKNERDEKDESSIISGHIIGATMNFFNKDGKLSINIKKGVPSNLGLGIYFSSDNEDLLSASEDYFIIGHNDDVRSLDMARYLVLEKKVYDYNNWATSNWATDIKYWDYEKATSLSMDDVDGVITANVLWTNANFWEDHNPSMEWEGEEEPEEKQKEEDSLITKIIKQGENRNFEFKSTLRYCLLQNNPQEYIEHSITKTITAFANTEGGVLLIGVDDDGNVLGLDKDINSFTSKSKDSFLKHFDNLIKTHFSEPIDAILKFGFEEVQSKTIFMVNVEKSNKPRFLITKPKGKEFYIRRSASSHSLDIEEATQYIIDKWYA